MSPINNISKDYKERRWHLLKVGANGDVRPFVHLKGWVIVVCALMVIMLLTIGWFLFAWLALQEELDGANTANLEQQQVIESLKNEKDSVLARLAIAQSKLKIAKASLANPTKPKPEPKYPKGSSQIVAQAEPAKKQTEAQPSKTKDAIAAKQVEATPAPSEEEVVYEKVIADNLFACAQPDDTSLTVEYKVINMGTRQQPVTGHAFVILKDADYNQDKWMVLPRAMLVNGKPAESRGQRFRIYNFRTIKFKFGHENPGIFTHATIFIFRHTGELIFERDFTLEPIKICQ
jgi:hypothetical protein